MSVAEILDIDRTTTARQPESDKEARAWIKKHAAMAARELCHIGWGLPRSRN